MTFKNLFNRITRPFRPKPKFQLEMLSGKGSRSSQIYTISIPGFYLICGITNRKTAWNFMDAALNDHTAGKYFMRRHKDDTMLAYLDLLATCVYNALKKTGAYSIREIRKNFLGEEENGIVIIEIYYPGVKSIAPHIDKLIMPRRKAHQGSTSHGDS